jgi:hypothetical protein
MGRISSTVRCSGVHLNSMPQARRQSVPLCWNNGTRASGTTWENSVDIVVDAEGDEVGGGSGENKFWSDRKG